ncbi:hypothetical protein LTS14_009645 [Recurvomyces mirabilis]|uniref:uncharacterized protein n=1 Tax=Recurvomyces mirabilis TaxID=574656 RepID=UPI002DDE046E|nr:hypothetical protein LTS14_009645 [Recurvomyces mirabilis]
MSSSSSREAHPLPSSYNPGAQDEAIGTVKWIQEQQRLREDRWEAKRLARRANPHRKPSIDEMLKRLAQDHQRQGLQDPDLLAGNSGAPLQGMVHLGMPDPVLSSSQMADSRTMMMIQQQMGIPGAFPGGVQPGRPVGMPPGMQPGMNGMSRSPSYGGSRVGYGAGGAGSWLFYKVSPLCLKVQLRAPLINSMPLKSTEFLKIKFPELLSHQRIMSTSTNDRIWQLCQASIDHAIDFRQYCSQAACSIGIAALR